MAWLQPKFPLSFNLIGLAFPYPVASSIKRFLTKIKSQAFRKQKLFKRHNIFISALSNNDNLWQFKDQSLCSYIFHSLLTGMIHYQILATHFHLCLVHRVVTMIPKNELWDCIPLFILLFLTHLQFRTF